MAFLIVHINEKDGLDLARMFLGHKSLTMTLQYMGHYNQELNDANTIVGKDVAMQIAAMNPIALDASGVSDESKDRERAIAREKAIAAGKPENLLDKIADGAVNSMLKESTLLSQPFVKDSGKTVEQYVKSGDKDLKVLSFKRVSLA